MSLKALLVVGMAGFVGSVSRYAISGWIARRFGEVYPMGTLVVNLSGCFAVGFLYYMLEERFLIDPLWRVGLLIGFLGGFTTFSSYGLQTFSLLKQGEVFSATANVLASNLAGLALVWLGYSGARLTLEKSIW